MKTIAIFIALALLSFITAEATPKYIYDKSPIKRFKPEMRPDIFYGPEIAMKGKILAYKGQNRKTNRFCAMGLVFSNNHIHMPVFWYEKKMLIRDWIGADKESAARSMRLSQGINYEKDVVDTQDEVGLSTYLQVRSNVQKLLHDCEKYGKTYVIKPFREPKPCSGDMGGECIDQLGDRLEVIPGHVYDEPPQYRFKLKEGPYSSNPTETALKTQILRHENQNKETNHFCVMGLKLRYQETIPIFWYEKKRLIYWNGADDEDEAITAMAVSEGLPYDKDVVIEAQDDMQLVHKSSSMQKLLQDCEKYGDKFTIAPFEAPKPCSDWEKCENKLGWKPEPIIDKPSKKLLSH